MVSAVERVTGFKLAETAVTERSSKQGKCALGVGPVIFCTQHCRRSSFTAASEKLFFPNTDISVNVSAVVKSADVVVAIYNEMRQDPRMRYFM